MALRKSLLAVLLQAAGTAAAELGKYRCVFIHGVGMTQTLEATSKDSDSYWGGDETISAFTPYCSSRAFLHQDTVKRGWDDKELQDATCSLAHGGAQDKVIRDTIVISHSMGNMIFAGAMQRGSCSLDASSTWISSEAPWEGSKAAPWIEKICSNSTSSRILRWLAGELSYCDPDQPGKVYRGYETLKPDFPGVAELKPFAAKYVSASICGTSPYGITSSYSAALEALAAEVSYGEPSDGMVTISSCRLPDTIYEESYDSLHYVATINHIDGTCRAGDGIFGVVSRQPGLWLAAAVARARNANVEHTLAMVMSSPLLVTAQRNTTEMIVV